jgi:hypothetical protein
MAQSTLLTRFSFSLRKCDRAFLRLANRPVLAIGTAAILSLLVNSALAIFLGVPSPAVHDEYSYWLAADTFANGRLTNPPHPLWVHFESMHVLMQPTYASKYPPGQGMAMALGQVLTGMPMVGVWISSALACAAVGWMLRAWTRPRWALLGSLLVALHPLMVDWNHNYWGGSVALLGGTLVLGAARRLIPKQEVRNQKPKEKIGLSRFSFLISGFLLGLGMAILANSRPYEGMILTLLAFATVLVMIQMKNAGSFANFKSAICNLQFAIPFCLAGLVLVITVAGMSYYNYRVTGNPLRMPYMVYQGEYAASPSFIWAKPRPLPEYRHKEIRDFWLNFELPIYEGQQGLGGWLKGAAWKAGVLFHSAFPSLIVLLSLAGLPAALSRERWVRIALLLLFLFYLGLLPVVGMIGHYAAPIAGLFFYLIVESLRLLRVWCWSGMRVGLWAVRCLLLGWCLWLIPQGFSMTRYDPEDHCHNQAKERAAILEGLKNEPGQHLVIVRYSPKHSYHAEWVYNEADIDGAKVVWAREMDDEHNRRLLEYFHDRHIWLIEADEVPPRLIPYPITQPRVDSSGQVK